MRRSRKVVRAEKGYSMPLDDQTVKRLIVELRMPDPLLGVLFNVDFDLSKSFFATKGGARLTQPGEYLGHVLGILYDHPVDESSPVLELVRPDATFWVQIWRLTYWPSGSSAYAEMRWHPQDGPTFSLHGIWSTTSSREEQKALRALHLLLGDFVRGGRPPLTDDERARQREVVKTAKKLKRDFPRLAWEHIAARVGVSESTLRSWRKKYKSEVL